MPTQEKNANSGWKTIKEVFTKFPKIGVLNILTKAVKNVCEKGGFDIEDCFSF